MTLRKRTRPYWTCRRCGFRNLRAHVKCRGIVRDIMGLGLSEPCSGRRPKPRVPKHAEVLRDLRYDEAARLSQLIHGGELGACAYCRKPKPEGRRHDRDHDHHSGEFRGLACFHCNREKLRHHTLETMRAGVGSFERVEAYYSERSE